MKNKKTVIKEFNDPFKKMQNKHKLAPATVTTTKSKKKATSSNSLAPNKDEVENNVENSESAAVATPKEKIEPLPKSLVPSKLNLKAENPDCARDLIDNWDLYLASGLLIGGAMMPIIRPALAAAAKTGGALIAPKVTLKVFEKFYKEIQSEGMQALSKHANVAMAAAGVKLKDIALSVPSNLIAMKHFTKARQAWQASRKAAFIGRIGLGGAKAFKNVFLLAAIVGAVWYGTGIKDLAAAGMESSWSAVSYPSTVMTVMIEFFVLYDTALEQALVHASPTASPECLITNVIASSVMVALILPAGGKKLTGYDPDDLRKMSPQQFEKFLQAKRAGQIADLESEIRSKIAPLFKQVGVEGKAFENYYKALIEGNEAAISRSLKRISDSSGPTMAELQKLNNQAVKISNKAKEDLVVKLTATLEGNQEAIQGLRKTGEETGDLVNKLIKQLVEKSSIISKDARAATQMQLTTIDGIAGIAPKGMSLDSADGILKLMNELDDLVYAGKIGVAQALKIHNNHYNRLLLKWAEGFVESSPKLKIAANATDAQRIAEILKSLNSLSKNDDAIKAALAALRPNGVPESANWLEKLLKTDKAKRVADVKKLEQLEELSINSVIDTVRGRLKSSISPDDLAKLETQIKAVQSQVESVSLAGIGTRGQYGKLAHRTVLLAISTSIAGAVVRTVNPGVGSLNDLDTYRKGNIAKSIAWDGVFPAAVTSAILSAPAKTISLFTDNKRLDSPSAEEAYQKALIKIVMGIIRNDELVATLLKEYIFAGNNKFFRDFIIPLRDENLLRRRQGEILNKFAEGKSNFNTIKAGLQQRFYAQFDGIGTDDGSDAISTDSRREEFTKIWWPVLMNIIIANIGIGERLKLLSTRGQQDYKEYWTLQSEQEKIEFLNKKVFVFQNPDDITEDLEDWVDNFYKKEINKAIEARKNKETKVKEQKENQEKMIIEAVKEMLAESTPRGYNPYPYHSHIGQENEPTEDFQQDWKDFEMSVVRDETRDTAIRVAKILVKDLELFGDVIDLIGKNQSVATEILKKLRTTEKTS